MKSLKKAERIRVKIGNESHYVGIVGLTSSQATINVSSDPQQAIFNIGDTKKFDVTNDNYYDISVTLNKISGTQANVTVQSINEKMPAGTTTTTAATNVTNEEKTGNENLTNEVKEAVTASTTASTSLFKNKWFWIILGVVVIAAAVGVWYLKKKKRMKLFGY
jgi:cobalamin biosynthesis Mg chelatase CobN